MVRGLGLGREGDLVYRSIGVFVCGREKSRELTFGWLLATLKSDDRYSRWIYGIYRIDAENIEISAGFEQDFGDSTGARYVYAGFWLLPSFV
ncbi:hypothetical protein MA16_Dca017278 [Dendrobium catenatum]|uniref:Uncharacterized protein n=1 Tax=Dendrobium catenatum TaxID=906689 RepID=A0A2I0VU58_9ASPA|nr:hypothetical protein MA16_Dca017278 [Dendrobium catenatum]